MLICLGLESEGNFDLRFLGLVFASFVCVELRFVH
jgi:hypothetical protein